MYQLKIETNKYTGNFVRELVAFSFGILQESQINHAKEYQKAFWNKIAGSGIDSFEDYIHFQESEEGNRYFLLTLKARLLLDEITKEQYENIIKLREKEIIEKNWQNFYDNYLEYVFQWVDDSQEETFYHIGKNNNDENGETNCIFIQLKKEFPEYQEKIIIKRIQLFFSEKCYQVIDNYIYMCLFETTCQKHDEILLVDLKLLDENGCCKKQY